MRGIVVDEDEVVDVLGTAVELEDVAGLEEAVVPGKPDEPV